MIIKSITCKRLKKGVNKLKFKAHPSISEIQSECQQPIKRFGEKLIRARHYPYRAQAVRVVFRLYNSPTCIPPDTAFFALNRLYTAHLHRESISLHDQYHLKPTVKQISLESRRFTQHGDRPFDLWLYAWDSHHMETAYVTCDYRPEIHTAWKPPMWLVIICLSFPPHRDRLCDLWLLAGVSHHMETAYVTHKHNMYGN